MSDFITTDVKVDLTGVTKQLNGVISDDGVMTEVHSIFAEILNPYVPYDTGYLSQTVEVTPDGITYTAPYASKQYYGEEFHHNTEHHPLATAHWDEVAMQTHKEEFANKVAEVIRRRLSGG